jgi:hypothetical protein
MRLQIRTKNDAFNTWALTALEPRAVLDAKPLPLVTVFLHRVCGSKHSRFYEGMRVLQMAFEAGQQAGYDVGPIVPEPGEDGS